MSFPALVEPGPALTGPEVARYARHLLLPALGELGQRRLRAARVLVVGAGGLGSPVIAYLTAAGVGTIGIVDDDRVELSNLQRQVIHPAAAVGDPKTTSAARTVAALDPAAVIQQYPVRLTEQNVDAIVAGHHLVIDGSDNFETRYLVDAACARAGIPDVWGSVLQLEGMVSVFWGGRGPRYIDLHPEAPPPGAVPSCAEGGVLGALCGTIGTLMATQAVLLICGIGRPLVGRVVVHDALDGETRTVPLAARPARERRTADRGPVEPAPPGEVATVALVTATQLRDALGSEAPPVLIDVREPAERLIVSIDGAVPMTADALVAAVADGSLGTDRSIVVACRSGARSAAAVRRVITETTGTASSLDGGILAWIDEIDPSLPRY